MARNHPVWSWVIIAFVGLLVIGALIPAEDEDGDDSEQAAQREEPRGEPKVELLVDSPEGTVKAPFVRLRGSVEATNAEGRAVKGVVPRVWIGGVGDRSVEVKPDDTFTAKVRLRLGSNEVVLYADWPGTDASDEVALSVERERSAAELAAIRERRRQRREAARQELINSAQTIDYDQLMKNADAYAGKPVTYYGQIFQIQEDPLGGGIMLLAVTDEGYGIWTDNVWVNYNGKVQGAEDDFLTVYGRVVGSKSYETQIGGETYVPEVDAVVIEE